MIWIETPTNPLLKVIDIENICRVAHSQPGVCIPLFLVLPRSKYFPNVSIDGYCSTTIEIQFNYIQAKINIESQYHFRPLSSLITRSYLHTFNVHWNGAAISLCIHWPNTWTAIQTSSWVQSQPTIRIYMNVLNSCRMVSWIHELLMMLLFVWYQSIPASGIVPSPFDCYQVNRSLKTLALRMEQHSKSAFAVAKFLETHPNVTRVVHPGLPSHPQHELALKQSYGHSGIMTFFIRGGLPESTKLLQNLKLFTLAESLGGYESLAELPLV